jgi:dipeptidyl-peptidase-4
MRHRSAFLLSLIGLIAVSAALAGAQNKLLTNDDVFGLPGRRVDFNGTPPGNLTWLESGDAYLQAKTDRQTQTSTLMKVNALSGESTPFFDSAVMEKALAGVEGITAENAKRLANQSSYEMNPAQTGVMLNFNGNLVYYEFGSARAARLTNNPDAAVGEVFSPDGRSIAFVRNNNLFVVDVATQKEVQLTNDGKFSVLNGRLDWVYEEEVYGRGKPKGFWWSPDSKTIAYLRTDEAPVKDFTIVDQIPRHQDVEEQHYPLAGDPNPIVKLGIVSAAGGETRWVDTSAYKPEDLLIVRVGWAPDSSRVLWQAQNREQTFLDLNETPAAGGATHRLFQEKTIAWVEPADDPLFLKDGSFLWRSEKSGFMHIYHYASDGKLIKQVTNGDWEARSIESVDEANNRIYFMSSEHSPIADQPYSIGIDGTGLKRLIENEGTHRVLFNPKSDMFIDWRSDVNTPTQVRLYRTNGTQARVIDENRVPAIAEYKLGKPEFLQVKTRDGFAMEAMMIRPPDFDPSKKYPVMSFNYSGPHSQSVRNSWGREAYMWHQMLAQKGYIIWICDNRSASGKGARSVWPIYKNFGELELRDLEDGVSYLKGLPYVDGSRIGIWGWSFGGFMTSYALTHSKSFKIGISGGTVTDWQNYDTIYTERYMMTPQSNPEGYKKSAPLNAAAQLSGKLLLIHGAIDDNVHPQNVMQFVYELQKADKDFQLMLYPKSRHGIGDPRLVRHWRQMMLDYILANL